MTRTSCFMYRALSAGIMVVLVCSAAFAAGTTARKSSKKPALTVARAVPPSNELSCDCAGSVSFDSTDIPVGKWVGLEMTVLRRSPLFSRFGYELYRTQLLDKEKSPVDPSIEHPSRHIKCDVLVGKPLTVVSVTPVGDEYLVEFKNENVPQQVFGKTHCGSIGDCMPTVDIVRGQRMFVGTKVYSVARIISVFDSVAGRFDKIPVSLYEPLEVIDVRAGTTPLPSQPLWVEVKTATGKRGFIPTRLSWTNSRCPDWEKRRPWQFDLTIGDPKKQFTWDTEVWETIDRRSIFIGMKPQQVIFTWGSPLSKRLHLKNGAAAGSFEWVYNGQVLQFDSTGLVGVGSR